MFELRVATSLARLWRDQGKLVEARDLLSPVYGWFTEGFDTLDLKEAKLLLEEALASTEVSGERWWQAELHRLRGRLLVARGQHDEGEACFRRAIEVSRGQRARTLELRAATSLARLWSDRGRNAEARDLLAPIYCWFTEGFGTLDLKEAKILLDAMEP